MKKWWPFGNSNTDGLEELDDLADKSASTTAGISPTQAQYGAIQAAQSLPYGTAIKITGVNTPQGTTVGRVAGGVGTGPYISVGGSSFVYNNIYGTHPKNWGKPCWSCGTTMREDASELMEGFCKFCSSHYLKALTASILPRVRPEEEYCSLCKGHFNACECPEKKALEEINK